MAQPRRPARPSARPSTTDAGFSSTPMLKWIGAGVAATNLEAGRQGSDMKFQVRGVDSHNGQDLVRVFEAPNGLAAERLAGEAGIFVQSVTLLDDSSSAPPHAPYTAPPTAQPFQSPEPAVAPSAINYRPPPAFYGWPQHKMVSGLGVASLVLGILGTVLFCFAPVSLTLAIVGLVLGVAGWIVAASSGGRTGAGM